jgi:sugar lactone lactonase YvrE
MMESHSLFRHRPFWLLVVLESCVFIAVYGAENGQDELGKAAKLFTGPAEIVAEHDEFKWLEGPVWSETGQFLLFSDVKWEDENNTTCGMIWKYDNTNEELSKFVECSGLIGPGDTPTNVNDYVEAGSNGLEWGWSGEAAQDLIICQHGKHRIVRINLDDVDPTTASINPDAVTVLADSYNGVALNSPNDVVLDGETLYFTDPPFGNQLKSSGDAAIDNAFVNLTQDAVAIYTITGDPDGSSTNTPVEPFRVLDYGNATNPWAATNGVALLPNGDLASAITSFEDPRFEVFAAAEKADGKFKPTPTRRLESEFRIAGENSDSNMPALNDGITYSPEHDVLFGAGPGGVYMYNGTTYEYMGFLRLDDLISNNVIGGGYLWMTVNQKLMRIPLATNAVPPTPVGGGDSRSSGSVAIFLNDPFLYMFAATVLLLNQQCFC